jgi:hypothetical protein
MFSRLFTRRVAKLLSLIALGAVSFGAARHPAFATTVTGSAPDCQALCLISKAKTYYENRTGKDGKSYRVRCDYTSCWWVDKGPFVRIAVCHWHCVPIGPAK